MTTTEHPAILRADIQAAWLKDNPQPSMRTPLTEVLAWAKRWRRSKAHARCVELTEAIADSVRPATGFSESRPIDNSQNHPNARHGHLNAK